MTGKVAEKLAAYALDIVIVISLATLAAIGRLDPMIVVGVCGPLLGARVAGLAKTSKSDDDGPKVPPSATLLLLAGAARLFTRGPAA